MKTYTITEIAKYTLKAESAEEAEKKFLAAIKLESDDITCEIEERDVEEA